MLENTIKINDNLVITTIRRLYITDVVVIHLYVTDNKECLMSIELYSGRTIVNVDANMVTDTLNMFKYYNEYTDINHTVLHSGYTFIDWDSNKLENSTSHLHTTTHQDVTHQDVTHQDVTHLKLLKDLNIHVCDIESCIYLSIDNVTLFNDLFNIDNNIINHNGLMVNRLYTVSFLTSIIKSTNDILPYDIRTMLNNNFNVVTEHFCSLTEGQFIMLYGNDFSIFSTPYDCGGYVNSKIPLLFTIEDVICKIDIYNNNLHKVI